MAFMEDFVEHIGRIINEEIENPELIEVFYESYLEIVLEEYSVTEAEMASFKSLAAAMASTAGRAANNRGFIDLDLMDWRAWRSHALNDLADAISDMFARRNQVFLKGTIANDGDIFKRMGIPHSALADAIKTAVGREYNSLAQIGMQHDGGEGDDWAAAAKDVANAKVNVKTFNRGGKTGFFVTMNPTPKQIIKKHGLSDALDYNASNLTEAKISKSAMADLAQSIEAAGIQLQGNQAQQLWGMFIRGMKDESRDPSGFMPAEDVLAGKITLGRDYDDEVEFVLPGSQGRSAMDPASKTGFSTLTYPGSVSCVTPTGAGINLVVDRMAPRLGSTVKPRVLGMAIATAISKSRELKIALKKLIDIQLRGHKSHFESQAAEVIPEENRFKASIKWFQQFEGPVFNFKLLDSPTVTVKPGLTKGRDDVPIDVHTEFDVELDKSSIDGW